MGEKCPRCPGNGGKLTAQLQKAFAEVGFTPSLSKVAAVWSQSPISVRLDDLDRICAALGCTVDELLQPEPLADQTTTDDAAPKAVGERQAPSARVSRKRGHMRRALPPN